MQKNPESITRIWDRFTSHAVAHTICSSNFPLLLVSEDSKINSHRIHFRSWQYMEDGDMELGCLKTSTDVQLTLLASIINASIHAAI